MQKILVFLLFLPLICNAQVSTGASEINIDALIQKAIDRNPFNNPQKSQEQFTYDTYEKIIVADSLNGSKNTPHSFFAETVYKNKFNKKQGLKQNVQGIRVAGFEKPRYEILGTTIESRTFYDEDFVIFEYRYAGPLSRRGQKHYNYTFEGDTLIDGRPSYKVSLKPKRPETIPGLVGSLWLDQETYAIQKVRIDLDDAIVARIVQEYSYFPEQQVYLPKSNKLYLEKGKTDRRISFFRGKIAIGTIERQPVKEAIEGRYLISTQVNSNFSFTEGKNIKHAGLAIEVENEAAQRPDSFWAEYRPHSLTQGDLKSFDFIEDIVDEENIERRLEVLNKFGIGYYTLSFFDFDLTYPIKYNNYEGLRLGIGGLTNERFSKHFRLGGYLAYGFKDHTFKYGIGGGVLLNNHHGAWLSVNYNDDLQEVGSFNYLTDRRVYSLFEPRLVNISQYYDYKTLRINQEFRVTPQLLSELQLSNTTVKQIIPYRFFNSDDGRTYRDYTISEAALSVRWTPSSKYLRTTGGTSEIYSGFPVVSAQVSKGISGVFNSDFDYTKVAAKVFYQVERLNKSTTQFLLEGKAAFGELPLTHLFHAFPNAPNKPTVMKRFSVAGIHSFETMHFGEFYSDRIATLEIKHRLRPFDLGKKFKPEMVFITRAAIGDIRNPEDHLDVQFKSLKHGFTETGFEINKILFGFGTSLTYRYGAYHLPKFADNIAFKFTFNLSL